jgi:peptidoglycan/LPS O-acetylase OafA/YrhL
MFYYLLYGGIVFVALKRGIRPTTLGMVLCMVLAVALDCVYFRAIRTAYVRSPGLLFGLGIIWLQGALVAEYRQSLRGSRLAQAISAWWIPVLMVAMGLWYSQSVHLQVVYVALGMAFTLMLVRFVAVEPDAPCAPDRGRIGELVRALGLASYPTYLFHGPIVMLMGSAILRWHLISDWRVTWLVLCSVGIGSGILLGQLAERPLMAWRAGYLKRLKQVSRHPVPEGGVTPILGLPQ